MTGPALSTPLLVSPGPRRGANPERPTSWREKLAALSSVPKLLGLVWSTHRGYTAAMILLRVARAFVPVAMLWVGKLIIDAVTQAIRGQGTALLWRYVAIEAG